MQRARQKKSLEDQALGRSRGGFSTKIHAATIDENCAVALTVTAGQAHDGRQFETIYESLPAENVLEAMLDRGYDADRIREQLAADGIEAVIPPLPHAAANCLSMHNATANVTASSASSTNSNNSPASLPATTNSPRPFSPQSTSSPLSSLLRIVNTT
jgi:transposase